MAGIEKICEYSGKYSTEEGYECDWNMYGFKYNSIQVLPKYKKLFKSVKSDHILYLFSEEIHHGSYLSTGRKFIENYITRDYCLLVPSIPGKVDGKFWNSCNKGELKIVYRKLKRLLSTSKLNIKRVPFDHITLFKELNKLKQPLSISNLDEIISNRITTIEQLRKFYKE